MKYLIPILLLFLIGCSPVKRCATKMPKETIRMHSPCHLHDFNRSVKIKAFSMDKWMVINPLKFDTINQIFKGTGIQFELVSIVPEFLDFDIDLAESRRSQQVEETFLRPYTDNIDVMLYYLPSKTGLQGYALVSDPQTIKEGNGKREIFVEINAGAGTIAHELGHRYGLVDKINGHCSDVMSYSDCGNRLTEPDRNRVKGFFREFYLKINQFF